MRLSVDEEFAYEDVLTNKCGRRHVIFAETNAKIRGQRFANTKIYVDGICDE